MRKIDHGRREGATRPVIRSPRHVTGQRVHAGHKTSRGPWSSWQLAAERRCLRRSTRVSWTRRASATVEALLGRSLRFVASTVRA